ncbi:MAG: hypothetical protein EPN38_05270 [Rhodanobacteraceae bacterium]|nr:MAG: hypothetical protein EPN38_05270 [Rhodanobacteraceae bacterium]
MSQTFRPSPFTDPAAVEAWDAWFRWRDPAGLRDVSIEHTWLRVASALASVEPRGPRSVYEDRFMEAMATWRLLPGERLLAGAGTGRIPWRTDDLSAVLNVAAFVEPEAGAVDSIDLSAMSDCAALAVRALDNAARLAGISPRRLRIGVVGVADTLALLGLRYDSDAGRARAVSVMRVIAAGCQQANIQLAMERGAHSDAAPVQRACQGVATPCPPRPHATARHGRRYAQLTAITSQLRLALFANVVADGIDPLGGADHAYTIAAPGGPRVVRSSGYALNRLHTRTGVAAGDPDSLVTVPVMAQMQMRAALQPWVDAPITYPLPVLQTPTPQEEYEARQLARRNGLPAPAWRDASQGGAIGRGLQIPSGA